jgi:hypothetical protein
MLLEGNPGVTPGHTRRGDTKILSEHCLILRINKLILHVS